MKRVTLILLMLLLSLPVLAQTKPTWTHGTTEYVTDVFFTHRTATDTEPAGWSYTVSGGWLPYVSEDQQVGALATLVSANGITGQAVGPEYRYRFVTLKYGEIWAGGNVQATGGGLQNVAAALGALKLAYALHVGNSNKINFVVNLTRPISVSPDSPDNGAPLRTAGFTIGAAWGKSAAIKVN